MASEKADEGRIDVWVPDLNLPVADMLPETYVQSEPVRLELYARAARCRSEDELNDLEEETTRRFGQLPPVACDFFAAARLRLECKRIGTVRLDVGSGAVAATFLPGHYENPEGYRCNATAIVSCTTAKCGMPRSTGSTNYSIF
jgi:transcription-repair coupling factor (superfamily II helicase)